MINGFTLDPTTGTGQSLTVTFADVKTIPNIASTSQIVVKYTATLNANAEIGLDGNTNKVTLTFSNNPNAGGENQTGTTPEDKVIVFTYQLDVTKIDGQNENTKLEGQSLNEKQCDPTEVGKS